MGCFCKGHTINVGRPCSDEKKEKIRKSQAGRHKTEEQRKKTSAAGKKKWQDPEYRKMMIMARKGSLAGDKHPMYGKHHAEESRKKMREAHIGLQSGKNHPLFGKPRPLSVVRKISAALKGIWNDPEYRDKQIKAIMKMSSPNKQETKLMGILNSMYPGEWKFVGDGQVIINGKCPDFINVNGQKKIIELYGEYWHQGDDPRDREAVFAPFGYETLVIWQRELSDRKAVMGRIEDFNKRFETSA